MFAFFESIGNVINSFIQYIGNIITGLITLCEMLVTIPVISQFFIGFLPGVIGSFALAFVAIRIVFQIVGR